jgi:glycerophosphoryl diester phosphodiesterase
MRTVASPLWPLDPGAPDFVTRIIAHRGLPVRRPENTVASLLEAVAMGADIVEVDVKVTRDGAVVLMHDATVDRTTDGHGAVADLSLAEIRALSAGGEPVPTLIEAFERVPGAFMVDYGETREAFALAELFRNPALRRRVVLTGSNVEAHRILRAAYPDIAIAINVPAVLRGERFWRAAQDIGAQYLNPHYVGLSAGFVAGARAAGFGVSTWTVDHPASIRRILSLGVDLMITNRADLAVPIRDARGPRGQAP